MKACPIVTILDALFVDGIHNISLHLICARKSECQNGPRAYIIDHTRRTSSRTSECQNGPRAYIIDHATNFVSNLKLLE
ncbi:hypothetical protein D9757_011393 [Collybiopsis confluens]|uniref:Uncharacterized protein n=1 Tax=Collybiopsis confluens TaxID=2823264 RepID=A0A8H5GKR9_9AGAR|nr:hypothetical protein D9757_011393 [Collybiopsis confluens]